MDMMHYIQKCQQAIGRFLKNNREAVLATAIVTLVVLLGNVLYVTGMADPNPLMQRSGLAVEQQNAPVGGYNTIDPNDGFTTQALGHHSATEWLRGDVPYWNYYEGVGAPLAGEMQSGALSPFVLLFAFANGNLLYQIIMEILAGVATYLFLRRLGIRWGVALAGGAVFALNGTFAWLHNAVFNPVAFLPLLLLGIELARSASERTKKGGWIVMAFAMALSLYSGFPETAFINALLAGGWAVLRLWSLPAKLRLAFFKKLVCGMGVGLLLAAPILIAFLGYLPYADVGWHGGAIGDAYLTRTGIPALFMPYIYGPIFGLIGWSNGLDLAAFWGSVGGYYTISLVFFAILGLFTKFDRRLKILLVAWIVVALLKTFGVPVISDIVNLIPTIENAAFYRYAPPSIAFALVILAAWGLDGLLKRELSNKKVIIGGGLLLALIGMTLINAWGPLQLLRAAPHAKMWAVWSVLVVGAVVGAIFMAIAIVKRKFLAVSLCTILAVEALILFIVPSLSTPKMTIDTGPVEYLQQNIGLQRFYTLSPIEPNYGSYYEVASINQNDLPVPKSWSHYLEKHLDNNTSALVFTGNYRRDPNGPSSKEEFFKHIEAYRYVGVKYLVTPSPTRAGVEKAIVTDAEAAAYGLKKVYVNKALEIFEVSNSGGYYVDRSGKCQISQQSRDAVSLYCPQATELVRKEFYMPGWKANVNGQDTKVETEKEIFQKITVPAGTSTVTFSYLPLFMEFGYLALVIGLGLIAATKLGKLQRWLP